MRLAHLINPGIQARSSPRPTGRDTQSACAAVHADERSTAPNSATAAEPQTVFDVANLRHLMSTLDWRCCA